MARRKQYRDEHGRFAKRYLRDELGRFAPKPTPRRPRAPARPPEPAARPRRPARPAPRPPRAPARPPEPAARPRRPARPAPRPTRAPARLPRPAKPAERPRRKLPARDESGRFVKKPEPRRRKLPARDEEGRFVKRPEPRRRKLPARDEEGRFRRRRPEAPLVAERSQQAEALMQEKLLLLSDAVALLQPGLDLAIKTFVNLDGSVDGELRIGNLPDDWRTPEGARLLAATLSSALRTFVPFPARPPMGGAFWASFGIRFGPQNDAEKEELYKLYKRFRGLFQIGTYPTPAWMGGALQVSVVADNVGLRSMIAKLMEKRGYPPTVILIRFVWVPDGTRPGHYRGEKGET